MSTIGIIGSGLMSKALGTAWNAAGHDVVVGSRHPESLTSAALGFEPAAVREASAAPSGADFVVLAIPFPAVAPYVTQNRAALQGRVIIDISNPFDALPHNEKAAVEYTADALGTTEGLVAAYKDNFAATIATPLAADGAPIDVKLAADDEVAKDAVAKLCTELNHRVIDCGPLNHARFLDAMVSLMLVLDRAHCDFTMKTGWKFAGLTGGAE